MMLFNIECVVECYSRDGRNSIEIPMKFNYHKPDDYTPTRTEVLREAEKVFLECFQLPLEDDICISFADTSEVFDLVFVD